MYDYVITYTFHENKAPEGGKSLRDLFVEKVVDEFPSHFGPEDFDQTTIAFNYNVGDPSIILQNIARKALEEYREQKGVSRTAAYDKEDKFFLLRAEKPDKKFVHIEILDKSNMLAKF